MKSERIKAPVRWYGGKGNMLTKLLPLVPSGGRPYVEPYCGSASLFFARSTAESEVLNDLNKDLIHFFSVFQDKKLFEQLRYRLMYTPYARAEFQRAIEIWKTGTDDPVLRAWSFCVRHVFSVSGITSSHVGNWSRTFISRNGCADSVARWLSRLSQLDAFHWRLTNVTLESRDGVDVIRDYDNPDAVFYVDPPYVLSTRSSRNMYSNEMTDEHHRVLIETLLRCQGAVVLSGYRCPDIHDVLEENGWKRIDFKTVCYARVRDRASGLQGKGAAIERVPRVESVWLNPRALEQIDENGLREQ